jgi:TPR repeat protein
MRIFEITLFAALTLFLTSVSWCADLAAGQEAYDMGDYETALTEWQPLADEGLAGAQFGVGLLYASGFGVPLDDDQALKWYSLAAEQGHGAAQCNLAVMHANGWGVPQSSEEAFKWYSLAAEQGVVPAQVNLAKMYSGGYGVELDNVQSLKWHDIAIKIGDNMPTSRRDDVARAMSAEEIAEAAALETAWLDNHQNLLARQ